MVSSPISIVIADDHPVLTQGLRGLLEIEPDLRVIGQASNAADVIQRVLELKPDILLLDLNMPLRQGTQKSDRAGLDAWAAVRGTGCKTKAILFAAEMETQQIVEAIELGVRGVLLKSEATELLIDGIRAVMSGACWEQTKTVPTFHAFLRTKHEELARRKFGLTPRELEVVSAIVLHEMSNKDIAQFFNIAEDTVKKHITSIYDKTGVSTRLELDHFAREHKLPIKKLF
jgi:two-component system, NarL family, nitrate/nitrite response regulator NarL